MQLNNRTFEKAHSLGRFSPKACRPVIVKFGHYKDKLAAFKISQLLRQENVFMKDDLPDDMENKRKELHPVFLALKAAKDNTESAHIENVFKRKDSIMLNGKAYTSEMLDKLPDPLQLPRLFTPTHNGVTAFYTKHSPLSNCSLRGKWYYPKHGTIPFLSQGYTL